MSPDPKDAPAVPFKQRDPQGYARADAAVKKLDPTWKACENCGGIFVEVCTNGCHLSRESMARFNALFGGGGRG